MAKKQFYLSMVFILIMAFLFVSAITAFADERQITTNPSSQSNPDIYGDKIVWQDKRNGNWDIYLYDLSTNTTTNRRCLL